MTSIPNYNTQSETFMSAGAGTIVGGAVAATSYFGLGLFKSKAVLKSSAKIPQFNDEFLRAAEKVIKDKNLGIKIVGPEAVKEKVKIKGFWKILEKYINFLRKKAIKSTKEGKNAFYIAARKIIAVNKEKFTSSILHELGHAINRNSKFWQQIRKVNFFSRLAPIALITMALLTPKKTEEQKSKQGILGKVTTFIKENVGKLSVVAMLPFWAEEIRASIVGNQLAKKYLSGDMIKSALKTNKLSMLSYSSGVALTAFSAYIANKVRDAVAKN